MKKLVYTAFVGFWAAVGTLVVVAALSPGADVEDPVADDGDAAVYTLEQVAEHDTLDDCWMVIRGRVYDFTDYIPEHPTRPAILEPWCGKEATEGMETKGRGRDHSPAAWAIMEDYLVGRLAAD